MSAQEELYCTLSNYPIDPPSPPPENAYPHYIKEEHTINLIESVIFFETEGVWSKDAYRWVKFAEIEEREVWKPNSLAFAETLIDSQKPLKPIHLGLVAPAPYKYTIVDGIHRMHALRNKSSTHVLALILGIEMHQMPEIPSEAIPFLEILKKKFLDNEVAGSLRARLNIGNIFILWSGLDSNDVKFSLLREGVDLCNVRQLPPDCQLEAFSLDIRQTKVRVTGTIFGNQVDYSGPMKEVVEFIIQKIP